MSKARFEAELIEGHKGVRVVVVPFDPEELWDLKPMRLAGRRHGWLIKGTANRVSFEGFVGDRWGRFFIIIDDPVQKQAKMKIGDVVKMIVEPTKTAHALENAVEQSKVTTQPTKARADAIKAAPKEPKRKSSPHTGKGRLK